MLDEKSASELVTLVKSYLERAIAPMQLQIDQIGKDVQFGLHSLKKAIDEIEPATHGKDGVDGINGKDGADGKPGEQGPAGAPGADGRDGVDGKDGVDGRNPTEDEIKQLIGKMLPAVQEALQLEVNKMVAAIELPRAKDGADGRDAIDLDILPAIDEEKSYTRGVYAMHKGGLWKSHATTKGMRGWECVVDGLDEMRIEFDGERDFAIKLVKSSGDEVVHKAVLPQMIPRGVYRKGDTYAKFDVVTYGGSMWIAQQETSETPGNSDEWKLSVKAGRNANPQVKASA